MPKSRNFLIGQVHLEFLYYPGLFYFFNLKFLFELNFPCELYM